MLDPTGRGVRPDADNSSLGEQYTRDSFSTLTVATGESVAPADAIHRFLVLFARQSIPWGGRGDTTA